MNAHGRCHESGITRVEVAILLAMAGLLGALMVPAFSRYTIRCGTAEAAGHMNKMWAGSVTYWEREDDQAYLPGRSTPEQFPGPSAGDGQPAECGCLPGGKCPGERATFATDPVWLALQFRLSDPYSYRPYYRSAGVGTSAVFTAGATGDLDCDGVLARFERVGMPSPKTGDIGGNYAPIVTNEKE